MKNISFWLTTEQMILRTKGCTRRLGWWDTQADDILMAVEKGQGLGKGGKIKRLYPIRILKAVTEPISSISLEDVRLEGFPNMTQDQFIAFFKSAHKGRNVFDDTPVRVLYFTEIEWDKSIRIPLAELASTSQQWFASCPNWYRSLCLEQLRTTNRNSKALKQAGLL